jgi:hypothetical protein
VPDPGRLPDVSTLTPAELHRTRRELTAALALARPGSPARLPIRAHLAAIDAELASRAGSSPASRSAMAPAPPASPARTAAAVAGLLADHGLTRIYVAGCHVVAVIYICAGLTAWTNGRQLWVTRGGQRETWPVTWWTATVAPVSQSSHSRLRSLVMSSYRDANRTHVQFTDRCRYEASAGRKLASSILSQHPSPTCSASAGRAAGNCGAVRRVLLVAFSWRAAKQQNLTRTDA